MTEGPQYKHHSELLQSLKGQRLQKVLRAITALSIALEPLIGRRILRVFSVGKEIFLVFEQLSRPGQEDVALKIHFGDGPGYQYEPKSKEAWGMVRKSPPRQSTAEFEVEFSECKFRLWEDHNFYSHIYEVVSFGYVYTVEARKHRDISTRSFVTLGADEAVRMLSHYDGYIVDAAMDQTIMPGVGNIIKSEGLFNSHMYPMRRCKDLSEEELRTVVLELNLFSLKWYDLCKANKEGSPTGLTPGETEEKLEKRCYGRDECIECPSEVYCVKLGTRQRITFFCYFCQPPGRVKRPYRKRHKHNLHIELPKCLCGVQSRMFHLYRLGSDHGRVFFGCRTKRCRFRKWLDQESDFKAPCCRCDGKKQMVARKVMGLRDNGRYFFQCADKKCKLRVWISTDTDKRSLVEDTRKSHQVQSSHQITTNDIQLSNEVGSAEYITIHDVIPTASRQRIKELLASGFSVEETIVALIDEPVDSQITTDDTAVVPLGSDRWRRNSKERSALRSHGSSRWQRHALTIEHGSATHEGKENCESTSTVNSSHGPLKKIGQPSKGAKSSELFVRRNAKGQFVHGRHGLAGEGGHLLSAPATSMQRSVLQTLDGFTADDLDPNGSSQSNTPITSAAEYLEDDEVVIRTPPPEEVEWQRRYSHKKSSTKTFQKMSCEDTKIHDLEDVPVAVVAAQLSEDPDGVCMAFVSATGSIRQVEQVSKWNHLSRPSKESRNGAGII